MSRFLDSPAPSPPRSRASSAASLQSSLLPRAISQSDAASTTSDRPAVAASRPSGTDAAQEELRYEEEASKQRQKREKDKRRGSAAVSGKGRRRVSRGSDSDSRGDYLPPGSASINEVVAVAASPLSVDDTHDSALPQSTLATQSSSSASPAVSSSHAVEIAMHERNRARSPSFSQYVFSSSRDGPDETNEDGGDLGGSTRNGYTGASVVVTSNTVDASAINGDGDGDDEDGDASVSASSLEREMLQRGDSPLAPYSVKPLLLEYKKSTSSIRKDFTTVDWYFSKHLMHRVRRLMRSRNFSLGWPGRVRNWWLAAQAWIVLALVGIATATSASVIHLVSAWLADLKEGYCGENFFSNRRVCCMDQQNPEIGCSNWVPYNSGVASNGSAGAFIWNGLIYILFATLLGVGSSWICLLYAPQAAGSGIAEIKVILGGFVMKRFLGIRTLFLKIIGLTMSVAAGMAVGKEGALAHVGTAWGHVLSRPFLKYSTNEVKRAEVLSAATAAGVCAAFGSPLGGVLFSLEVVSSYFPPKTIWRSFWCAICAALTLQYIDPFQTGKLVQFAVGQQQWHWFEIMPFMVLGVLGGSLGALFNRINVWITGQRKTHPWMSRNPVLDIAILTMCTSIISFPNLFLRSDSSALLAKVFTNCYDNTVAGNDDHNLGDNSIMAALCDHQDSPGGYMSLLIVSVACQFLLTAFTYGSAVPSGVFMPTLLAGGLMGRVMGWAMVLWHQHIGDEFIFSICKGKSNCISPALYSVIGAAAMLGGITRMTLSLAVIMMEVTGGLESIVPIMVGVVCSKWSGDAFGKKGLYIRLIELLGFPHVDTHAELELVQPGADCMTINPVCITTYGHTLQEIKDLLASEVYHGFPIIDNPHDRLVTGFIARSDLENELDKVSLDVWREASSTRCHFSHEPPPFPAAHALDFSANVDKHPLCIRPSTPIDRVNMLFQALGLRYALCCSPRGRLMGLIKKKDLLVYLRMHNGQQ